MRKKRRKLRLTRRGNRFFGLLAGLVRSGDDEDNGSQNDGAGQKGAERKRLSREEPAEKESDNWVHESVGGDVSSGAVFEDVDVGAEAKSGAKNDQVNESQPGAGGDLGGMEIARFAGNDGKQTQHHAAAESLHGPTPRPEKLRSAQKRQWG